MFAFATCWFDEILSYDFLITEIETFHHCRGHKNIIQLIEYFEEADRFYLVFEKIHGGQLLDHIQNRVRFTEKEASYVIRDLASALQFLHKKGKYFEYTNVGHLGVLTHKYFVAKYVFKCILISETRSYSYGMFVFWISQPF